MAKQKLLLVDADPRSLRVLDVSLRKAGYSVTATGDAMRALEMMDLSPPDLILSDTRLPGMDGFAFRQQVAMRDDWSTIPFMFLSSDTSVESKVRGLELGVEDYLTKPIYIKEIITRVNLVLSRKQREGIEARASLAKTQFTGSLADMGLVDLLQTIDISRKSGVLLLQSGTQRGALYFTDGRLIDAEVGPLKGEAAVYRALVWSDGTFTLDFRPVRRDETITSPTQGILMEGMRRLDEWGRLLEQLPPFDSVFEVDEEQLLEKLSEIPDEINRVLRLFDGKRSLLEVVDTAGGDDLATLMSVSKLYFEGLVFPTGRRTSEYPKRELEQAADDVPGAEDSLESDMVPGHEPTGLTNRPPAASPALIAPPVVDVPLPPPVAGPSDRAEANAVETSGVSGVPDRAAPATPDASETIGVSRTVTVGTEGAKTDEAVATTPDGDLENDATSDDSDEDGAEGEAEMAKKDKRKKKMGRIEIPAAQAVESAGNVIQFPAKSSARAIGGGAVAVGDGAVRVPSHESEEHENAPAREATAKVSRTKDEDKPADEQAEAKKEEPKAEAKKEEPKAEEKKEEPKVEAKKEEPKAEAKPTEAKKPEKTATPETVAKNVAERDEKADSSDDWKERKRKKQRTSSSGTLSAQGAITITGEHPAMADEFFNAPSYEATRAGVPHETEHETWEDLKEPAEPTDKRMAVGRNWTIGILLAAVVGIGGYVLWQKVILPQPAELGGPTVPATLPTPVGPNGQPATGPAVTNTPAVGSQFVTGEPTTGEPTTATGEPATGEPTVATGEPTTGEPTTGEPAVATGEPTTSEPAVATGEPAVATGEPPTAVAAAPAADYATLLAQAQAAARRNRASVATPLFEQALAANPNGSEAMSGLAMLNLNRNKMQDAADLANRAVAADPTNSEGWIVLGAARDALHDRAGSREAYRLCVERGTGRYVSDCRAMMR